MTVERARETERLLTFLDAIVAIAVTLLVLPLVEITREVDDYASAAELLRDNEASLGAFVLSFVIISRLWLAHHHAVRRLVGYDRQLATLLLAWAMTIVFMPFPTALVAERGGELAVKALYVGTLLGSMLLFTLAEVVIHRRPALSDDPPGERARDLVDGAANLVTLAVALLVMLVVPATGYIPLLLLVLSDRLADLWRRVRGPRGGRERDAAVEQ